MFVYFVQFQRVCEAEMSQIIKIDNLFEVAVLADKNRKPSTTFRERLHPMEYYSDYEFWMRYRFMKTSVSYINCLIKEDVEETRGDPLSSMDKLLITLRFYATGSFQRVLGDLVNIDQSTVCRAINETSLKIAKLFHRFVRLPTPEQQQQYVESFYEKFGFPRVVGLIDGTHIPCKSPGGLDAELFRCRKGYFSINCQVTCNADMRIMDLVARWHGSAHDQTIFNFSTLKMKDLNEPSPPPPEIPLPALYQEIHPVVRNLHEALPDNSTRNVIINTI
ncbi:putative nuclease HARBI1 [Phlebotomus papatasi]|uniref:putative nuclease HARBI1 n=1 Tax=Phlebotomus papatasi TaxID=29031 RepID=UPI00248429FF|nr:putative nuclease HARBI1 [Phlebotomus papatasi]